MAKATVCKIVIPSSTLGAASKLTISGKKPAIELEDPSETSMKIPSIEAVFVGLKWLSEYFALDDIWCRDGEIGRRKGLKIPRSVAPCRFDSGSRHHSTLLTVRG